MKSLQIDGSVERGGVDNPEGQSLAVTGLFDFYLLGSGCLQVGVFLTSFFALELFWLGRLLDCLHARARKQYPPAARAGGVSRRHIRALS